MFVIGTPYACTVSKKHNGFKDCPNLRSSETGSKRSEKFWWMAITSSTHFILWDKNDDLYVKLIPVRIFNDFTGRSKLIEFFYPF